ncbi:MAG: protein kinase, partial [Candidatus Krumholzibacteriia bacterium]
MDCPRCGQGNREEAQFCDHCGAAMRATCPQCESELRSEAKFCDRCGYRIEASGPVAVTATPAAAGSVTPPVPSGFADERYQIKEFLGEGGRKKVYLARDTRLDRDVALALIKTEGLDTEGRVRVRREAQAMGRLGDHGHIVTVYDVGECDGRLFIVCQYMAGGDLESVLEDAPDRRLAIPEAVRVAGEVAQGLEHAHGKDVIHRDLKPGNIWLTEATAVASKARRRISGQADSGGAKSGSATPIGTAKLGDFGLAVALDRSRITQEGMMVGTAAYMPPEQAVGGNVDARSDLYALGCVLYETVCGRPPFQGDDAVTVISQHLNTAPIAPSWHNSAVPPPLESLILDLLAKAPDDRPSSAQAVCERLRSMDLEPAAAAAEQPQQEGGPRAVWGQFVGRTVEMARLKKGVDDAVGGKGSTLMLVGEPGIGKTRTSEELATYAKMRGAQVLLGRCYEGEGAPAFWPWVQIIREHVYAREEDALRSEMGSGAPVIAQMVSDVGDRLPGLPAPPELEPEQARFRLFDSVTSFLRNAGRQQPLVLILDDLHWADKPSLLLLQFLARTLPDIRVLVLGTYRDVELDRRHPLAELLSDLRRERLYERILLRGFSADEVAELLEAMAQQDIGVPGRDLALAIHRETEGNPFFVQEIILHLGESGDIYRDLKGQWITRGSGVEELRIPEGIREVIGRRLSRLTDRCNELLSVGAVIGRDFDQRVLELVSGLDGDELLAGLEEALGAGLINEDRSNPGGYRFSHALIRETLYGELSTPRRVRFHRQIGEVTESIHKDRLDSHLAALAYHFAEGARVGGDVDKAVDFAVRAAERASAQVAYEEAVAQYERALQVIELKPVPGEHERAEVMLALVEDYLSAGMPEAARSLCADAAKR